MVDLLCVSGTSCLMVYSTGGIFYTTLLLGQKIAYELLERRSAIYSSRPYSATNKL